MTNHDGFCNVNSVTNLGHVSRLHCLDTLKEKMVYDLVDAARESEHYQYRVLVPTDSEQRQSGEWFRSRIL